MQKQKRKKLEANSSILSHNRRPSVFPPPPKTYINIGHEKRKDSLKKKKQLSQISRAKMTQTVSQGIFLVRGLAINKSSVSFVESAGLSYLFQEHFLNIMIPGGEGSILSTSLLLFFKPVRLC